MRTEPLRAWEHGYDHYPLSYGPGYWELGEIRDNCPVCREPVVVVMYGNADRETLVECSPGCLCEEVNPVAGMMELQAGARVAEELDEFLND